MNASEGISPLTFDTAKLSALARERKWLPILLNAYAFLENSLQAQLQRLPQAPACGPGCTPCCHQPIPATPPEILGIRFSLTEGIVTQEAAQAVATFVPPQEKPSGPLQWACPFLLNGVCAVYPVRPFACRRFMVFHTRCAFGEDVPTERPQDLFSPSQKALLHALRLTLPLYSMANIAVNGEESRDFFTRQTVLLQHVF